MSHLKTLKHKCFWIIYQQFLTFSKSRRNSQAQHLSKVAIIKWNHNIRTVNTTHKNQELIQVFEEIQDKCLRSTTSNKASDLRKALEDSEDLFWLRFFYKLLPHVNIIYNLIQSRNMDCI